MYTGNSTSEVNEEVQVNQYDHNDAEYVGRQDERCVNVGGKDEMGEWKS